VSRPKRPTLRDVAALAGVSRTTASYVLNGRADAMRIAEDTQARVHRAVAELGFRPDRVALSLRTNRTKTIGLISDHVASGEFASRMLTGASAASRRLDHLLVIGETEGDPDLERQLIDEMLERKVDGIVYTTLVASRIAVPDALRDVRTVLLNCFDPESPVPAVIPDEYGGGRAAARVLLDAGTAGDVAVIGISDNPSAIAGEGRLRGIRDELGTEGREVAARVLCQWEVDDAYQAVAGWLADGGEATALVCLNDRIAMGAYEALDERGLTIPGDVSVVSFDGSSLAGWLRPALTSVALPFDAMGARAVELLIGPSTHADGPVKLTMTVQHGRSVRGARAEDVAASAAAQG